LEIDEAEGKKLGDAVEELGKIYGHTINPKTAAWVNFAAAAGVVYGPRFVAYRERMKRESAEKPKTAAATNLRPTTNAAPDLEAAVRRHSASNAARAGNEIPNPSQFWNEPLEGW
jgi:hypothetical protein